MNIDFTLPFTSAVARRLVHISQVCKVDIDPAIITLAGHDLVNEDDAVLPLVGIRKAATQFLIDCDFRCAIPRLTMELDQYMVLNALRLANFVGPITIIDSASSWKNLAKKFEFSDIKYFSLRNALLPENQTGRRDGILIIEWASGFADEPKISGLAREYPRTIIFGAGDHYKVDSKWSANIEYPWWDLAECLFPELPNPMDVAQTPQYLKQSVADLAIFYNTFLPHFVNIPGYQQAK